MNKREFGFGIGGLFIGAVGILGVGRCSSDQPVFKDNGYAWKQISYYSDSSDLRVFAVNGENTFALELDFSSETSFPESSFLGAYLHRFKLPDDLLGRAEGGTVLPLEIFSITPQSDLSDIRRMNLSGRRLSE